MTDALALLLLVLAAYRAWRLVALDDVTWPLRRALFGGDPDAGVTERFPGAYQLVTCPWCLGSWFAFAAVAAVWALRPLPLPALWFGAVAAGVGIVAEAVERLEPGDW